MLFEGYDYGYCHGHGEEEIGAASRNIDAYSCLQVTFRSNSSLSESLHCFLLTRPYLYIATVVPRQVMSNR